jgi:hypothetical protein
MIHSVMFVNGAFQNGLNRGDQTARFQIRSVGPVLGSLQRQELVGNRRYVVSSSAQSRLFGHFGGPVVTIGLLRGLDQVLVLASGIGRGSLARRGRDRR